MEKGSFITIYGINNIGKSTHSKILVDKLKMEGYDPIYVKYPVYNLEPTGPKINSIIRSSSDQDVTEEELQTLFMKNRKDFEPTLLEWLKEGKIIVAEDYRGTGVAWGTAKGLSQEWVEELNSGLLAEDFVILLVGKRDLDAKENIHLHERDDELVMKVDKVLKNLAKKNGWHIVKVQDRIEDTAELIWKEVEGFIKNKN